MKLIEFENYSVRPTEEALLVKPIRKLYNSDRTKNKEFFFQQLSYLFFMVDPRSPYADVPVGGAREAQIIEQEGLDPKFKPSDNLKEAMELYEKLTVTTSKKLLEATRVAADALKDELNNSSSLLQERTDKGARVTKANDVIGVLERLLKVIPQLQDLERKVDSEIKENSRARGGSNSLFEDGV